MASTKKQSNYIKLEGREEEYRLLKDIQKECSDFINDITVGKKKKTFEDFQKVISRIETRSELNYYFLDYLQRNNKYYKENGETWDYGSNLKMLKDTLTDKQYELLEKKDRENPIEEIVDILKTFVSIHTKKLENGYNKLLAKYPISFIKLNFPLLSGIERLRLKYYRDLLVEKNISANCKRMSPYIEIIENDKELFNTSIDDYKFNLKIYLLILTLTVTFNAFNCNLICNFFTKGLNGNDESKKYENIKKLENGKYSVKTSCQERIIDGKNYILSGLEKDISNYRDYPLDILLLRNESYQKFDKDGGKGFIYQLKLYNSFFAYIKSFIRSKAMQQALNTNSAYNNIEILLKNDKFLEEMLNDEHVKFLPFYGAKNKFGYTNKDLLLSFINSIPELVDNAVIDGNYTEKEIKNLTNICLLISICAKFITSLHEFVIHLVYGYLYFVSEKNIDSASFKEGKDKDGGFSFERLLNSGNPFNFANVNIAITLLDGVSCEKNLIDFQNDLSNDLNIDDLKRRIKDGEIKGFLKDFLVKYPIDFDLFQENITSFKVSLRGISGFGIFMNRDEIDTYGGGKAIKK